MYIVVVLSNKLNQKVFIMDLRRLIIERKVIVVLDPAVLNTPADDFYSRFGSSIESIAVVAKAPSGRTYYNSENARQEKEYSDYFESYASLGDQLGINVYAVINAFSDEWFGQDPMYKTIDSEGNAIHTHVCPNRKEYWHYLSEISKEVVMKHAQGVILTGLSYINSRYCFCEHCRKEFSEISGLPADFNFDDVKNNPSIWEQWVNWRKSKISEAVNHITDKVWSVRKDVYIIPTVYYDMEVGGIKSTLELFGQDPLELVNLTGNLAIHINPWSPLLPDTDTQEYQNLLQELSFVKDIFVKGYSATIFYWGPISEQELTILSKLSDDLNIQNIFVYPNYPASYARWREAHLGIA